MNHHPMEIYGARPVSPDFVANGLCAIDFSAAVSSPTTSDHGNSENPQHAPDGRIPRRERHGSLLDSLRIVNQPINAILQPNPPKNINNLLLHHFHAF